MPVYSEYAAFLEQRLIGQPSVIAAQVDLKWQLITITHNPLGITEQQLKQMTDEADEEIRHEVHGHIH